MKKSSLLQVSVIYILLSVVLPGCGPRALQPPDPAGFTDPGSEYAVHTWWHWLDNAITREGITADLEAMKQAGISTATILNVSLHGERDLGVEPVLFGTPEWFGMFRWALEEADRLGIAIGVHNCDGWSTSGGPWVTPEQSMKLCVWSKRMVSGPGNVSVQLPEPASNYDFYRDIAVLGFPSLHSGNHFAFSSPEIRVNGAPSGDLLFDGNPFSMISLTGPATIDITLPGPMTVSTLALHPRKDFQWGSMADIRFSVTLQAADRGSGFRTIAEYESQEINQTAMIPFPETTAGEFRVLISNYRDSERFNTFGISELELLPENELPVYFTEIPHHLEKTATTKADAVGDLFAAGEPGALSVDPLQVTDLTALLGEDGVLRWDVPAGDWTILRIGYTTTGVVNGPATLAGRGLECDKMDTSALNAHFTAFPAKLAETAGEFTGNTFEYLFIDSWECKYQNWTQNFPADFARLRGYSIIPWLPVLSGEVVGNTEETERFLHDYRMTIAEMIEHNYYEHYNTLCHRLGVASHAEVIYGGTGYPPLDVLRSNSYMDVPMFEFWAGLESESGLIKYEPVERAGSDMPMHAAALYGKQVVPAEAYTGYANYSETPWDLKLFGDRAFCTGVNQMVLHSYVHQPGERKPGITLGQFGQTFNRHNPWWPYASQWFDYHRRIQYLLQKGTVKADLLCFVGDRNYDPWSPQWEQNIPPGFRVQKCNSDILLRAEVTGGSIMLDNGMKYRMILLPDDQGMELATLKMLEVLVKKGAILWGPKPVHTLSMMNAEENDMELGALADKLWGPAGNSGEYGNTYGKGRVYGGSSLEEVIAAENFAPDFSTAEQADPPLIYIHKKTGSADLWFVANQEDREVTRTCRFLAAGSDPQLWDPLYGGMFNVDDVSTQGGITEFSLTFPPKGSLFVLFGIPQNGGLPIRKDLMNAYPVEEFNGTIAFDDLLDRAPVSISGFKSYTESDDPEVRYYSGEASYRVSFDLPDSVAGRDPLYLSLGAVADGYRATLNGHTLGSAVFPDYLFNATSTAVPGANTLEVKVGNCYRNRIIGEIIREGELKTLWTTSPIRQYLDSGKPLKAAGIEGPVSFLW
ncbi:MAG: glycosyl hydrolase [Bacteroidota bacterium]